WRCGARGEGKGVLQLDAILFLFIRRVWRYEHQRRVEHTIEGLALSSEQSCRGEKIYIIHDQPYGPRLQIWIERYLDPERRGQLLVNRFRVAAQTQTLAPH